MSAHCHTYLKTSEVWMPPYIRHTAVVPMVSTLEGFHCATKQLKSVSLWGVYSPDAFFTGSVACTSENRGHQIQVIEGETAILGMQHWLSCVLSTMFLSSHHSLFLETISTGNFKGGAGSARFSVLDVITCGTHTHVWTKLHTQIMS